MIDHLSYSSINTWLLCPRSWKFRYIDKVEAPKSPALVFGSAFHAALEEHIAQDASQPPLSKRWNECWQRQLGKDQDIAWDKPEESYRELGEMMLSDPNVVAVVETFKPFMGGESPTIEVPVELRVPDVPVPVIGYIDIIEADGVPCDFKTSARSWSQKKADGEMQATFYLASLNQSGYDVKDLLFRYYVFIKNLKKPKVQIWETYRIADDLFWLFGLIRDVYDAIDWGVFPPNPGTWKCSPKWCEYWDVCRGG